MADAPLPPCEYPSAHCPQRALPARYAGWQPSGVETAAGSPSNLLKSAGLRAPRQAAANGHGSKWRSLASEFAAAAVVMLPMVVPLRTVRLPHRACPKRARTPRAFTGPSQEAPAGHSTHVQDIGSLAFVSRRYSREGLQSAAVLHGGGSHAVRAALGTFPSAHSTQAAAPLLSW